MRKLKLSGAMWIFAFVFILAGVFFAVSETVEAAEVNIDSATFPDEVFRGYISYYFDLNNDTLLSDDEINAVTTIDFYEYFYELSMVGEVQSLKGIEYFSNLKYLSCYINSNLTELDLSKNVNLEELNCGNNWFTELNLSQNVNLVRLNCNNGKLTSLDLSNNTKLEELVCSYNDIKSLDVSKNKELIELSCSNNELQSLNIKYNTNLQSLDCESNNLTTLDVSKNLNLAYLCCADNYLQSLDVSSNKILEELYCSENNLETIDVANCPDLKSFNCDNNNLKTIDVTKNPKLEALVCEYNQIETLDVTYNLELGLLSCFDNKIKVLDLSKNTKLNNVWCSNNQLTSLDISKSSGIGGISCDNNQMEVIVTDVNTFDLSTLPGKFDISKTSNWTGGTINETILTFMDKRVSYTYDIGGNKEAIFTLVAMKDVPQPSIPSKPSSTPAEDNTKMPASPSAPVPEKKVSAGMIVTDAKSKSIYKVNGSAASGYTVTYVRPSSKKVASVTIPTAVTVKGISCKVTAIENNAFKGQKKLKKVIIGANVTTIGKKAFSGCKKLTKIVVKAKKMKKVGAKAFEKISPKAKIKVPKNKKRAYKKLFKKNTGVKSSML